MDNEIKIIYNEAHKQLIKRQNKVSSICGLLMFGMIAGTIFSLGFMREIIAILKLYPLLVLVYVSYAVIFFFFASLEGKLLSKLKEYDLEL